MKSIGFVYAEKLSHYEHTKHRADVVAMRDNYLEWIDRYRADGYRVYYQDESWIFKNMACTKVWKYESGDEIDSVYKVPSGKGERSIISHVGCAETGLLDGCFLLFRGSKSNKDSDYHTEMNWEVFSHWCETKVFPASRDTQIPSVLVLDRETYHTVLDEEDRWPVNSWNKKRLADSIVRWEGIPDDWPLNWRNLKSKPQLLQQARNIYPNPKYKIQKIADSFNIKILFLPVAHPELNPIEMVWSFVKRNVASKNMHFKLSKVESETAIQIGNITASDFNKYAAHARKEEDKYRLLRDCDCN